MSLATATEAAATDGSAPTRGVAQGRAMSAASWAWAVYSGVMYQHQGISTADQNSQEPSPQAEAQGAPREVAGQPSDGPTNLNEILAYAVRHWRHDQFVLAILHRFTGWQDARGTEVVKGALYRVLADCSWIDERSGDVHTYTRREASTLVFFAMACADPTQAPTNPTAYCSLIDAELYMAGAQHQTLAPPPAWLLAELGTLGFVTTPYLAAPPPHVAPGGAAAQGLNRHDERLNRAMVKYIQTAWAMQDMHELEIATREASLILPEVD